MSEEVTVTATLSHEEALAFAQFLKRAGYYDYHRCADTHGGDDEVYEMLHASDKIRTALAEVGYAPR